MVTDNYNFLRDGTNSEKGISPRIIPRMIDYDLYKFNLNKTVKQPVYTVLLADTSN